MVCEWKVTSLDFLLTIYCADLILEPLLDGYDLTSNGVVTEHQDSAVVRFSE